VVDARNDAAVAELRRRKRRPAKPLAVMMPDLETLRRHVDVPPYAEGLLVSPQAPIVLLPRRSPSTGRDAIAPSVAPGAPSLGVFLPYTPLHLLLLGALGFPVVATSGNASDQPMLHREDDAARELTGICDAFLDHDRPIARPADDSVLQVLLRPRPRPQALRRARGYAPLPILAPRELPALLALGGQKNSVFAVSRGREVILSQHLGDLEEWEVREAYRRTLDDFLRLYGLEPALVAHDLHPDYFTTSLAGELAERSGLRRIGVQHHHAHLAACLLENQVAGRALGITWDGTGWGPDRTVWGGEFLLGDATGYERVATLHPFRLPGGEQAIRATWRTTLALLHEAFDGEPPPGLVPPAVAAEATIHNTLQMIRRGLNAPVTTSVGRLCDGVAALLGISFENTHQAQSPQLLENAAWRHGIEAAPFELPLVENRFDWRAMITEIIESSSSPDLVAARFHHTLIEAALRVIRAHERPTVLAGGVFCNRYLTEGILTRAAEEGLDVYAHSQLPPTDGSLSVGQLWVGANRIER
jgi:hydrogenase maturation protein HypF